MQEFSLKKGGQELFQRQERENDTEQCCHIIRNTSNLKSKINFI